MICDPKNLNTTLTWHWVKLSREACIPCRGNSSTSGPRWMPRRTQHRTGCPRSASPSGSGSGCPWDRVGRRIPPWNFWRGNVRLHEYQCKHGTKKILSYSENPFEKGWSLKFSWCWQLGQKVWILWQVRRDRCQFCYSANTITLAAPRCSK